MQGPLDFLPIWAFFLASLALLVLSVEIGHRFGQRRRRNPNHEKEGPLGVMVGAALGLLAFLLAFEFSLAASRFDARRTAYLDEVNAISTTYLRAGMLPERQTEIRGLLRQYTELRLHAARTTNVDIDRVMRSTKQLHDQLWSQATDVARKNPNSEVVALFVESLNHMIDLHATRSLAVLWSRIPGVLWASLYAIAVLTLGLVGYSSGLADPHRSPAIVIVALSFSILLTLIADLDRPHEGSIRVGQQLMINLQQSMQPGSQ